MKSNLVKGSIIVGVLVPLCLLLSHYMSIGEGRIIGAAILVFALIATAVATLDHFNNLCSTPPNERQIEIRRQKYYSEIAAAAALTGVAISLWFVFVNFDMQNMQAKLQRLASVKNQLENVLSVEFCNSKPYREQWCTKLRKDGEDLSWLIVGDNPKKIADKVFSLSYTLDQLAGESDNSIASAASEAKDQVNRIVGLEERHRTMIALVILTVLLIAGRRAVSGKVAIAAFEYYDALSTLPAKPVTICELLMKLKCRLL